MQYQLPTIDPGPAAVLDLSALTVAELGALTETIRDAYMRIGMVSMDEAEDFAATEATWRELLAIRLEVRGVFLRRFFEVGPSPEVRPLAQWIGRHRKVKP